MKLTGPKGKQVMIGNLESVYPGRLDCWANSKPRHWKYMNQLHKLGRVITLNGYLGAAGISREFGRGLSSRF